MNKSLIVILSTIILLSLNASAQSLVDYLFIDNPKYYEFSGKVKSVSIIDTSSLYSNCKSQLEFNTIGKLIYSKYCSIDIVFISNYLYDTDGKLKYEVNSYNDTTNEYLYDNIGNMIEKIHQIGSWTYKYDKNRNQIERTGYISEDFVERWRHIYDDENRRIREDMIDEYTDSLVYMRRVFKYDEFDNIISQVYLTYGSDSGKWVDSFKYDEHNNITEWKREDDDGSVDIETYTYKYDNYGNWVEKTIYDDGEIVKSISREIEYWK